MDVVPSSIGNYSVPLGVTLGGLCCRMFDSGLQNQGALPGGDGGGGPAVALVRAPAQVRRSVCS
jgi:hypothetical protein